MPEGAATPGPVTAASLVPATIAIALTVVQRPEQSVQVAAVRLGTLAQDLYNPQFGQVLAYSCILFIVPAVLILFFQRTFVSSIATSGVTGQ